MTDRQRFAATFGDQPRDRIPAYYFGQWDETHARWLSEGLSANRPIWQQTGLDPDWELGMWDSHGLVHYGPRFDGASEVIEETADWRLVRHAQGAITRESKRGASIPEHVKEALDPTRESWQRFVLALHRSSAQPTVDAATLARKAQELNVRPETVACFAGSLYGWPRDWMGVEAISLLSYDDPALYEEIIATLADHFIALNTPLLSAVHADFVYIFEDCCGRSGPLFSPDVYRRFYHRHYARLVEFYKSRGVKFVLLDSDGLAEPLIPCWLDSGIDIIFPIEVGAWHADPIALRRKFGKRLRMMGGFDKHLITQGPATVRKELLRLKPLTEEGGFIPIPDHRIPPSCSLDQFRQYVQVFREVYS